MINSQEQLINFIDESKGKIVTIEFDFRFNFAHVTIDSLHVQEVTTKQILLSDLKDDKQLTKSKISLCNIDRIEVDNYQIEIFYNNAIRVLISAY